MKKYFYTGLFALLIFEILNVYFIMPMPGSQEMNSIDLAYFLHSFRWIFRIIFLGLIIIGIRSVFQGKRKWIPIVLIAIATFIIYTFNYKMSADKMFLQPEHVTFKNKEENKLPGDRLVIGVEINGDAKSYPVEYLTYHHQVQDIINGTPVIVTYCSVCRTGRVFEPLVNGKEEKFRLVGMDHFNAMFEDATTKSWWRQATGEAITGKLKGTCLPEIVSTQMTVDKWFDLFPNGKIMQPDIVSINIYDSLARFEQGKNKGRLTRTDTNSWKDKSWVIGVTSGKFSKAYDWNDLKKGRIINDSIDGNGIVIILSDDDKSFAAFEKNSPDLFKLNNDNIISGKFIYDFAGKEILSQHQPLKKLNAYQEFWHSWRTFHPNTQKYVLK